MWSAWLRLFRLAPCLFTTHHGPCRHMRCFCTATPKCLSTSTHPRTHECVSAPAKCHMHLHARACSVLHPPVPLLGGTLSCTSNPPTTPSPVPTHAAPFTTSSSTWGHLDMHTHSFVLVLPLKHPETPVHALHAGCRVCWCLLGGAPRDVELPLLQRLLPSVCRGHRGAPVTQRGHAVSGCKVST